MKIVYWFFISLLSSTAVLSQVQPASIEDYLKSIHAVNYIPGFSVVVVKNNKVIFSKGYGVETVGKNKPFTTTTSIAIGSLTKSFTALAVMKLVERGRLDLNAPIIKYLPWFHTANRQQSDKITTRMLLSNTSGLYAPNTTPAYDLSDTAMENFVKDLAAIYLYKEPGNSYEYSNAGFIVAGLIISKVSGMSYTSFLEKEIFKPLGMNNTTTNPGDFDRMDISQGHYPSIKTAIAAKREPEFESAEYIPAGSLLHSNAEDIGKYLVALTIKNDIINNTIKKSLWTSNINFPGLSIEDGGDGKPYSYGLGWMISKIEERNIIHHGGSTGKTSSFTAIDTANDLSATILMNIDMTFIDKYSYPAEMTILNNVLRLATHLPSSTFAHPIAKDITLNNYELKQTNNDNYIGEYKFRKGGDAWVYFGVDLKIQKTADDQLEGIIYRGKQIVNKFMLDFVNESVAVSRNIDMPGYLTFKLTPAGRITSAYFNNIEFIKKENHGSDLFTELNNVYGNVNFSIPKKWKFNPGNSKFSAHDEKNNVFLNGGILPKGKFSFDSLFQSAGYLPASVKAESKIISENIGTSIWQQKIVAFQKGNETFQSIIFITKNAGAGYWFMLSSSKASFTSSIKEVAYPLLISFREK